MSIKSEGWRMCKCGKRGFATERSAQRALGRAQAKRNRRGDARGSRRGTEREHRFYACEYGSFHLTKRSRREYEQRAAA